MFDLLVHREARPPRERHEFGVSDTLWRELPGSRFPVGERDRGAILDVHLRAQRTHRLITPGTLLFHHAVVHDLHFLYVIGCNAMLSAQGENGVDGRVGAAAAAIGLEGDTLRLPMITQASRQRLRVSAAAERPNEPAVFVLENLLGARIAPICQSGGHEAALGRTASMKTLRLGTIALKGPCPRPLGSRETQSVGSLFGSHFHQVRRGGSGSKGTAQAREMKPTPPHL